MLISCFYKFLKNNWISRQILQHDIYESNKIIKPLLVPIAIISENLIALGCPASKWS